MQYVKCLSKAKDRDQSLVIFKVLEKYKNILKKQQGI